MNQKTLERYANEARDLAREKQISIPLAIYEIAEKYDISSSKLAQELGRRGGKTSKRHALNKPVRKSVPFTPQSEQELFWEREMDLFYKRRNRGFALARENELRKGFKKAGHLDDY